MPYFAPLLPEKRPVLARNVFFLSKSFAHFHIPSSLSLIHIFNIAFPSSNSSSQIAVVAFDPGVAQPLQAAKDRTAVTVRWAAHDDNGDDLTYALYLRGDGETVWRLLKDGLTDKAYSFDAALVPDGGYQIRVVASDAPSHTPADALTGVKESERFEVDTTPPSISALKAEAGEPDCKRSPCVEQLRVSFDAEDGFSPIDVYKRQTRRWSAPT